MSFIASIIAAIATSILKLLGKDIADYIKKEEAELAEQKQNKATAEASVKPLIDAKTGDEVSNATRSAMDGT